MLRIFIFYIIHILVMNSNVFSQNRINDTLKKQLDQIYHDDQYFREKLSLIRNLYKPGSEYIKSLYDSIRHNDSINLRRIESIISEFGWIGSNEYTALNNSSLFFVILHSDFNIQSKYLGLIENAVREGKEKERYLAMLKDRMAVLQGKDQIYGTQVALNSKTNKYILLPIIDPENINKRRSSVGLSTIEEYLERWHLKWDLNEYKSSLPALRDLLKNEKF